MYWEAREGEGWSEGVGGGFQGQLIWMAWRY